MNRQSSKQGEFHPSSSQNRIPKKIGKGYEPLDSYSLPRFYVGVLQDASTN